MNQQKIEARAVELISAAKQRWLVKDELVFLLLHYKLLGIPIHTKVQIKPTSGAILFYDIGVATDYKKDGWKWQRRKDGSGRVREDRAKLVINREVIVLGSYVHSSEIATFHRRSYSLRGSDQNIVFVHYFDEIHKTNLNQHLNLPHAMVINRRTGGTESNPNPLLQGLSSLSTTLSKNDNTAEESIDSIMKNCFEMDYAPANRQIYDPPFNSTYPRLSGTNGGIGSSSSKQDPNILLTLDPSFFNCSLEEIFYSDPNESINTLSCMLPPSPIPVSSPPAVAATTVVVSKRKSPTIKQEDVSSCVAAQELVRVSDFSPGWDFIEGGAKILICLERPLQITVLQHSNPEGNDFLNRIFIQFGGGDGNSTKEQRVSVEKISDTVLRCAAPSATSTGEVSWFIGYVDPSTPHQIIQVSTLQIFKYRSSQQNAPPPVVISTSMVDIDPSSNNCTSSKRGRSPSQGHIASSSSIQNQGEQEQMTSSKPATIPAPSTAKVDLSSYAETELNERQCKIRVVERLSEVHRTISVLPLEPKRMPDTQVDEGQVDSISTKESIAIGEKQVQLEPSPPLDSTPPAYTITPMEVVAPMKQETVPTSDPNTNWLTTDDTTVEKLSDQELEKLSEKLLERVVQQLVTLAHTNVELLEELNSLDEAGLSLLHYVSFYNYTTLVPLLVSHGAQINQQSTQGYTSLHLAAGCGHFDVVQMLVKYDADLFITDFDGLTPADRAEKSGNQDVGAYLRQLMLLAPPPPAPPLSGVRSREPSTEYDEDYDIEMQDSSESSGHANPTSSTWSSIGMNHFEQQEGFKVRSNSTSSIGGGGGNGEAKSPLQFAYENHEHNRKLLLGAFSTMSLHDKCALSLGISRDHHHTNGYGNKRRGSSVEDESVDGNSSMNHLESSSSGDSSVPLDRSADVKSVIAEDEESMNKLEAAMELMGPEEIQSLEEEAKVIQHNVRAWLLRRSVKNMRETTKKLQEVTKNISHNQQEQPHKEEPDELMRERAAVTVQAATRSMLARKSFLQTKNVTIKVQAATRGVLCRKNFARMKTHALASLVIQRNIREWLNKQETSKDSAPNETKEALDSI